MVMLGPARVVVRHAYSWLLMQHFAMYGGHAVAVPFGHAALGQLVWMA
jgi:hypothetical protein